jgi:polyhydroxybutyrate depolymerase
MCGPAAKHHIDDVGFLVRVIDLVNSLTMIDTHRVYCTGHSNGGMMAYRLAASAEGSSRIAAFSAVGGCAQISTADFQAVRPVSVMHIHSQVYHSTH